MPGMRAILIAVALLIGTSAKTSAQQATIRVKLLDADSNKAVKHIHIALNRSDTGAFLQSTTDKKGVAVFQLQEPLPEQVSLDFSPGEFGMCSPHGYPTKDVVEAGVVGADKCKKHGPKYSAKPMPGELVLFGKKVSIWQNILQEIP